MTFRFASVRAAVPALATLLVLLSAGTAAGQDSTSTREVDPFLSSLVDHAALVRALAALQVPDLPPDAEPVFELYYDSAGGLRLVTPADFLPEVRLLPEAYTGPVMDAIRAHAKPRVPVRNPRMPTYLVVKVRPKPEVTQVVLLGVGEEQAELTNRSEVGRLLAQVYRRLEAELRAEARFPYTTELRIRILTNGTVDSAFVERSSGDPRVDEQVVAVAMRMRFRPARLYGEAVRVWSTIPVTVARPN